MALSDSKALISRLLSPAAIAAVLVILAMANTAESQTTSFTYDFNFIIPSLTPLRLQGDAHFHTDSRYLRLTGTDNSTNALRNSAGRVLHSIPVPFWQPGAQVDFETTVKFLIKPNANSNNPADGLAFFMAPVGTTIPAGSSGGNFGVFEPLTGRSSSVFAVEFDIFSNGIWDPRFRHIGIDIESRVSVNTTQISDSMIGNEVTLRVNYVSATGVISVVATTNSQRYEVRYVYDLSTILPQQVQVGLAASTGYFTAVHDVIAWYFTATMVRRNGITQVV